MEKEKKEYYDVFTPLLEGEFPKNFNKTLQKDKRVIIVTSAKKWDVAFYFDAHAHILIKRKGASKWGEWIHPCSFTSPRLRPLDEIVSSTINLLDSCERVYITFSKYKNLGEEIDKNIDEKHKKRLIRYIRSRQVRGTTAPQEPASIKDFPHIFAETDWGYIAGSKRGDKPVYFLDKNIQVSFLDLGLFHSSFIILHNVRIKVTSNQIDYNDMRDLMGSRTRHRYSINAGGNKTIAVCVDDSIFSKVGIPHIIDHTTNGNGHWIAIADVTDYDLTKIKEVNISKK